jgi:hypothetical protein
MTNRVTEILDDGTIYCFDIDKCMNEADKVVETLRDRDGEIDYDYGAVMFSLFITSIHVLSDYGWTREELLKEVIDHYPNENE